MISSQVNPVNHRRQTDGATHGRRRRWWVGLAAVVTGAALLRTTSLPGPPCMFNLVTGYPCLGCGSTRAIRALLRLDVGAALALNPLFVVASVIFAGWLIRKAGRDFGVWPADPGSMEKPVFEGRRWLWPVLVVAMMANWAYLLWRTPS